MGTKACRRRALGSFVSGPQTLTIRIRDKDEDKDKRVRTPKAIVLEPARDLAEQTHEFFRSFSRHLGDPAIQCGLFVGGTDVSKDVKALKAGCDVATGTPGRIIDMVESGRLDVSGVRFFVLDEADRLLDSGNRDAILKLFDKMPKSGRGFSRLQVLLFSATLHSNDIGELSQRLCEKPTWVDLKGKDAVPDTVHHACVFVDPELKTRARLPMLLEKIREKMHTQTRRLTTRTSTTTSRTHAPRRADRRRSSSASRTF